MYSTENTWVLVLAAGKGSRLSALTTTAAGVSVPKQFCSLHDGATLLDEAFGRARSVTSNQYICTIVAAQHRCWWEAALGTLPIENIIVQPENRGTALGVLLPLLHIISRNPNAQLIVLPSDHYVRDEATLNRSLQRASEQLRWRHDGVLVLGLKPDAPDSELGYIVPGGSDGRGALYVEHFIEKPSVPQAHSLVDLGALWNAFIVAATAQALLAMFNRCMPKIVTEMREAVRCDLSTHWAANAVAALYRRLPDRDCSRHVFQGQESHLRVLPVPACGWSDLGTPQSVTEVLRRSQAERTAECANRAPYLSLAAQHSLAQAS